MGGHTVAPNSGRPLVAQYVEMGGLEVVYLDRSGVHDVRHWTTHHLLAPNMQLIVDPLDLPNAAR